jgi:hypothetical protein
MYRTAKAAVDTKRSAKMACMLLRVKKGISPITDKRRRHYGANSWHLEDFNRSEN